MARKTYVDPTPEEIAERAREIRENREDGLIVRRRGRKPRATAAEAKPKKSHKRPCSRCGRLCDPCAGIVREVSG